VAVHKKLVHIVQLDKKIEEIIEKDENTPVLSK